VLFFAIAATAYVNRDLIRIKIASVYARVTPKPVSETPHVKPHGRGFFGDAPWALSALPECFTQTSVTRGDLTYVLARVPRGARLQLPGTLLRYADCVLAVRSNDALVTRSEDRFLIPAPVKVYRNGSAIALLRRQGSRAELRTYSPSKL
jgi:hypothetical protein